jgi:hypothetical protein
VKSDTPAGARSVRTEWAEWDLANEAWKAPTRSTIEEFRSDGKISVSESRFGNGPAFRVTHAYDDAGLLTESQFYNGDTAAGRQTNFYDERGRLIRQTQHGPEGERVGEECIYSPDGSYTRVMYLPTMEGNVSYYCAIDDSDYYLSAPGTNTMTTAFDSSGYTSEVLLKDANGGVLRRLAGIRDESGRLVKDELFLGGEPLDPDIPTLGAGASLMTTEFTYDERGRRVELVRRMFGLSEARVITQYDDDGNRTETTTEREHREAEIHEGNIEYPEATVTRRHQARFTHKFDARGNWTERVVSQRHGDNPDFTLCSIERREIVYYDDPA